MHDLKALGEVWAEATSADLTGLVEKQIELSGPRISEGAAGRLLGAKGSVVHTQVTTPGEDGGELAIVAKLDTALSLAAVQLGKEPGQLAAAELDGEAADAYKKVMDLCVGILGRVLDEEASLPGVSLGEIACLELPAGASSSLASGNHRMARFELAIAGDSASTLDLLLPSELAARWFGPSEIAPEQECEGGNIALIDPAMLDRDEIDALSEALHRKILSPEVAELDDEVLEELAECSALILGWDLAGHAGLDVLEMLLRDPTIRGLRIALSSEEPTPAMVSAATRWGAYTFLCKPYDAAEIQARLLEPEVDPEPDRVVLRHDRWEESARGVSMRETKRFNSKPLGP